MKQAIYGFFMVFCVLFMGCGSDNGVSGTDGGSATKDCVYTFTEEITSSLERPALSKAVVLFFPCGIARSEGDSVVIAVDPSFDFSVSGWTLQDYFKRFYPTETTTRTFTVNGYLTEAEISEYEHKKLVLSDADKYAFIRIEEYFEDGDILTINASLDACYAKFDQYRQSREELAQMYSQWEPDPNRDRELLLALAKDHPTEKTVSVRLSDVTCRETRYVE